MMDLWFVEVNLYSKNFYPSWKFFEDYIVIDFVWGIYNSGLSSMYLRENLTTPRMTEKRIIEEKI